MSQNIVSAALYINEEHFCGFGIFNTNKAIYTYSIKCINTLFLIAPIRSEQLHPGVNCTKRSQIS